MTDNPSSNPTPEPQDQPPSSGTPTASPRASGPSQPEPSQNWEVVNFPGQMAITDVQADVQAAASPSAPLHRTEELIQLIQDLNQCNDALLIRVSDLEESLERSQAALQAEVERTQSQGVVTAARPPAPAQVAQLLSELDAANDGLRRATIHNETLQTELESSQQRVAQLERECTLLQQRFSEKTTALQQAEDSCRDLKARLHRQQRYTLQFKTALEKCLNMASEAQHSPAMPNAVMALGTEDSQPVVMPKAQEIQPWTAPSVVADHQAEALSNLIHSFKPTAAKPSTPVVSTPIPAVSTPVSAAPEPAAPATWAKPAAEVPAPAPEAPVMVDPWLAPTDEAEPSPGFTEPSPWGAPLIVQTVPEPVEAATSPQTATPPQIPEPVADFPEPFQAKPVVKPNLAKAEPALTAPASPQPATAPPAITPAVYPQRSPRKISSLAAVQLPSFGRPPRRS